MNKYAIFLLILGLILSLTLVSCEETPPNLSLLFDITILDNEYLSGGSYNFGLSEPEGAGKSANLILTNSGEADITVTAVTLSDSINYSLTVPELPATTAAGDKGEASVTFKPQTAGTFPAAVGITVEGFADPFVLNLTGEGNYAPTLSFGITVSGADVEAANGFYARNEFKDDSGLNRPLYTKSGTTNYYCYVYDNGVVNNWCIDDSLTADSDKEALYEVDNRDMVPPEDDWLPEPPTIIRHDITGTQAYTDEVLTANYLYSDADGDEEDTDLTLYQWYRSEAEDGTYEAISLANAKTYLPTNDQGYYLKVEVIPVAAAGIPTGIAVLSSPTIEIAVAD